MISFIYIDTEDLVLELDKASESKDSALEWVERMRDTLIFGGRRKDPLPFGLHCITVSKGYVANGKIGRWKRNAISELKKRDIDSPDNDEIIAEMYASHGAEYEEALEDIKAANEAKKRGFTAAATTREGVDVSANGCNPLANHYDQEALDKPTISAKSPAGAGVNFDSTQTIKRPDASSGNAEGVILTGSPIFLNCSGNGSRAACTSATSGQTISATEALEQPGAGEVPPESVSAKPSPALPVPAKKAHGEFGNVLLTDDEFAKLQEKMPNALDLITELDQYIESQGKTKKYKSHYATLLNWSRRKAQEAKPKQGFKTAAEKQRDELQKIADYYASKEVVG